MLITSFGGHCPSTSWVRSRKLSMQLGLCAVHVCCKLKRIQAISPPAVGLGPADDVIWGPLSLNQFG